MDEPIAFVWKEPNIRCQLWLGPRDRDFVRDQPLEPVGDHPRDPQLALRHLFRSVPGVASPRRGTVPCSRGAMEARYGGTADHRGRLSVEDALAFAVGTLIAERPPHRSGRAGFPHPAPTSGV